MTFPKDSDPSIIFRIEAEKNQFNQLIAVANDIDILLLS
jgi:hypothetical protein